MKRYRLTYKSKDGSLQYLHLLAENKDDARQQADEAQARRHARFPLTFARLEQAASTGEAGMIAVPPGASKAVTTAWVDAEVERRKKDQARYDNDDLKLVKVEEEK